MAVEVVLSAPTEADIAELIAGLRAADAAELRAVNGLCAECGVRESVAACDADFCFAARAGGVLLCLGGCSRLGAPWLLATDALARYRLALTRQAKAALPLMLAKYPLLRNAVDRRQHAAIAWLAALGFRIGPPLELRAGVWVRVFEMGA